MKRGPGRAVSPLLVAFSLGLVACSGGDERSAPTTAPEVTAEVVTGPGPTESVPVPVELPSTSVASSTVATAPPSTPAGEVSIRAKVGATFASARVITLAEPVAGFTDVAFTAQTRYRRATGATAVLADLAPGTAIEVRGQRGSGASLLAREVVLL